VRAQLTPAHYLSPKVFEREQSWLFGHLWIFAGLTTFVQKPDEFFTCLIGGHPVVVQNFEGDLYAFQNVCAHRGKLIQTDRYGTRPLVCGYHGWRYDRHGRAATIPFERDCYRFEHAEREALQLRRFALRQIGKLIFVNVSDEPLSLTEQFTPALLADLEAASEAFDDDVLCTSWRGCYNWKLAYENLRDGLHPRFVHTKSLNLEVRFGAEGESGQGGPEQDRDVPPLSQLSFGGIDGELLHTTTHGFHAQVHRWGSTDAYFNWLLYPNTHLVSPDGGYLFSIEHHRPVAPGITELVVYYTSARKRRQYAGASSVLWEYAKGAKRILDEDTAAMEQVQTAFPASSAGTQGHFEHQNRLTDRWYLRNLSGV
jgi:carnitine monooxygenase subunit